MPAVPIMLLNTRAEHELRLMTVLKLSRVVHLLAGLVLAPMSYAPHRAQGLAFVPSMALGMPAAKLYIPSCIATHCFVVILM